MELILGFIGLAVLVVFYLRRWLLRKEIPQQQAIEYSGELFAVGAATLARSGPDTPRQSVIAVHGFVENFLYFTEFYKDPALELILFTSADYHTPVTRLKPITPDWATVPKARPGTIAYDADVLNQALEHLARGQDVRVHGHSRGGAVVLEAARRRPDLFEQVEVILEAPVLPQGKPCAEIPPHLLWFVPFVLPFWQQQPISPRNKAIWGPLDDRRKRSLIMGLPFNPRHCSTLMANLKDMGSWMPGTGSEIYQNVKRGAILVPGNDHVLDPGAMLASAQQAENLQVIEIAGGSHFVIPDNPESIPPLPA
ncbi:alpha/beta hydrolase [Halopseudomonas salegens]|uniref:Pimeloyl-ACP methyl ester carboxylesterase n=1 Tax=Halopseudomonas salegens TaxID=1434072 RepID=A0A1H2HPS8_9GAMM|nr:alpha/beta hydrolase [Halopseudomonas salegens]SDU33756.1 Pimeloyl-ACP methyl ester carboxylesterase [Halopseudomonas salegens]